MKFCVAAGALVLSCLTFAQERIKIDQVAGKTGELHVQLTERSPLSSLAEMAKRMGAKPDPSIADYDLSTQDFYVYVPSAPDVDGKYGLIDVLPFMEGHGFTPAAQKPILEKYHLIWIAPMHGGTEQPEQQRMGEMIDAVYNARKAWPISDRRVYAMITTWQPPASGTALYYADQFAGVLYAHQLRMYAPLHIGQLLYKQQMPRPADTSLTAARKLRMFSAIRDSIPAKDLKTDDLTYREQYQSLMKATKRITVPDAGANIWSNFAADWFEQGIQFLDSDGKGGGTNEAEPPSTSSTSTGPHPAPTDGRLTLEQVPGKTGEFHLQLTERSPLSALPEMAKRLSTKLDPSAKDYDLSAEDFYVYVPQTPGEDGKYGLIDALPFGPAHAYTPPALKDVLEKYHLIWIGAMHGGDDAPAQQRIGEMIDAVYNARKAWPISDRRVYAFITSHTSPAQGTPIYYSDQFTGVLINAQLIWFNRIMDPKTHAMMPETLPPARAESMLQAKNLKFFIVLDSTQDPQLQSLDQVALRDGYLSRFRNVKSVPVESEKRNHWSAYTPDWFEAGIQYLDEGPAATASAASTATTKATTRPIAHAPTSVATSRPVPAPASSKDDQAKSALSLAKSYLGSQRWSMARQKLQKIVDEYPDTEAATEAKKLLDDIKGK
ncbi:MAG TPA: hypothetical protein VL282_19360 [Tepidisphaeraceae bacterium]|nr:hypothetical protein [Tepidisphaeraceae bacterium]